MSIYQSIFDDEARKLEERLKRFNKEATFNAGYQLTGQVPNRNLQPLNLLNDDLFDGVVPLERGGTSADLSGTGPGVVIQDDVGSPLSVLSSIPFGLIDWSSGLASHGQPLLYDVSGPTAAFGALNLGTSTSVTGTLPPNRGGTGVDNNTRTLTVSSNSGTLAFSGSSFTLTIPASGTAALLGAAQTFTANQTIAADLIFSGTGRRITGDFGNATGANRPSFQSSVTNDTTIVQAIPNGTGTTSGFAAYNTSDPANSGRIVLTVTSAAANFNSSFSGTGSAIPLNFLISGVQAGSFGTDQSFSLTKWLEMIEITAPAAGAANTGRLFLRDNGAGKTQLCVIFNTGAIQVIATQP